VANFKTQITYEDYTFWDVMQCSLVDRVMLWFCSVFWWPDINIVYASFSLQLHLDKSPHQSLTEPLCFSLWHVHFGPIN
jgi:hypothetical protein